MNGYCTKVLLPLSREEEHLMEIVQGLDPFSETTMKLIKHEGKLKRVEILDGKRKIEL